jgi:hypothetical protein
MGAEASAPAAAEVKFWDTGTVASHLCELGAGFVEYSNAVEENGVTGAVLLTLEGDDLDEIGMKKLHKKRILAEIDNIKGRAPGRPKIPEEEHNKHQCDHPGCERSFRSLDGLSLHQDQFHTTPQPPPLPSPDYHVEANLLTRSTLAKPVNFSAVSEAFDFEDDLTVMPHQDLAQKSCSSVSCVPAARAQHSRLEDWLVEQAHIDPKASKQYAKALEVRAC